MNILIANGNKLVYADISKVEAENGVVRFYQKGNDNPIESITFDQYKDNTAEREAKLALLYLIDEIEGEAKAGHLRDDFRFEIINHDIVRTDNIDSNGTKING